MKSKKLSIIIPCYNEGNKIRKKLTELESFMHELVKESKIKPIIKTFEIIVLSDGAKDNTASEILAVATKNKWIKPVINDENHGKGFVIRQGFGLADGEYIMFMDADLSVDINGIRKALLLQKENPYAAIIGSRKHPMTYIEGVDKWHRKLMSWVLNFITQTVLPLKGVRDTQCGFKMYPYQYAKFIVEKQLMERFSFDLEHLLIMRLNGGKILEMPIHYYKQETSTVNPVRDTIRFLSDLKDIWSNYKYGHYKVTYERKDIECD